jgi:hypothetical protein
MEHDRFILRSTTECLHASALLLEKLKINLLHQVRIDDDDGSNTRRRENNNQDLLLWMSRLKSAVLFVEVMR